MVQEPQKTTSGTPDVAAVGPQTDDFPPTITVTVLDSNGLSMDERITQGKQALEPVIEAGQLEILSEEKTKIDGNDAFTIQTKGVFETSSGTLNVKFKETTILSSGKFYIITFASSENNFDTFLPDYANTLNSFETLSTITRDMEETISTESVPGEENGGGCLIATATFGSELSPQVQMLREIRDNTVLNTASGTSFMVGFNQFYYSFSPAIADLERENEMFKETVKLAITPLLTTLSILNYVDIDSEEEMLGYGIGIILLNLGMYLVFPTLIIQRIRKTIH
jgi:peptidyl-prolyl cis-trans isomerase B (cyclophilin B)